MQTSRYDIYLILRFRWILSILRRIRPLNDLNYDEYFTSFDTQKRPYYCMAAFLFPLVLKNETRVHNVSVLSCRPCVQCMKVRLSQLFIDKCVAMRVYSPRGPRSYI